MGQSRVRGTIATVATLACFVAVTGGWAVGSAQVTLAWDPPQQTTDGEPLANLAGYRVYIGTASGQYDAPLDIGNTNVHTLSGLDETSTLYVAVTAYTSEGEESDVSGEMAWSPLDSDANGMSDAWEQAHLSELPASQAEPDADADGDGLANLDEFIVGSNPTNVDASVIVDIVCANGQVCVLFDAAQAAGAGYTGKQRFYALERCANLAEGTWEPVPGYTAIAATNQTVTYAAGSLGEAAMCRARVWLQ